MRLIEVGDAVAPAAVGADVPAVGNDVGMKDVGPSVGKAVGVMVESGEAGAAVGGLDDEILGAEGSACGNGVG